MKKVLSVICAAFALLSCGSKNPVAEQPKVVADPSDIAVELLNSTSVLLTWSHDGKVVSNCLKRPAAEFERRMLDEEEIRACLQQIIDSHPEKRFLLTVSPIRHLGDGAHLNAVSKARLLLAADACKGADYFPAYEILLDELRDYRFYAEDMVHPSPVTVNIIWERFLDACVAPEDLAQVAENEKAARRSAHRPLSDR